MGTATILTSENLSSDSGEINNSLRTIQSPGLKRSSANYSDYKFFIEKTTETNEEEVLESVSPTSDLIVKEMTGVVMENNENDVLIKLEMGLAVNFPKVLFEGKKFIKFGQPIKYQIKIDHKGYKYQDFVPCLDQRENPYKDEIAKILDSF